MIVSISIKWLEMLSLFQSVFVYIYIYPGDILFSSGYIYHPRTGSTLELLVPFLTPV